MKKIKRSVSNYIFLLKPWLKYGKRLVLVDLITRLIVYPIRSAAVVTIAQAIITAAQSGRGAGYVVAIACAYIAVIVICWGVREARQNLYASWKALYVESQIEREIYEHAMRMDFKYVDDPEYFDSYKMATEEYVRRTNQMYEAAMQILGESAGAITIVGIMAATEPIVIALAAVGVVLSAIFRARSNVVQNKIWRSTTPHRRRMNYLTRILYVKSANADLRSTNVREHLFEHYDKARDARVAEVKKYMLPQFINRFISTTTDDIAAYIVMIYVALGLVSGRIESIGVFTTLISAAQRLSGSLGQISYFVTELMAINLYTEKVRGFFDMKSEIEQSDGLHPAPDGALSVELKNVSFSYPNSSFGLKNLNIKIAAGEKIAIVGENGAGKTTLSKLLLRLYDTDSGDILYNGKSIREYDIKSLRRRIGSAFQEPQIYAMSIRANMQVYNKADDETLTEVLDSVNLKLNLDGELSREFKIDGVMLSGGQTQKLGLTRILHGKFGLLLLDEPSSALDPLAEYELTRLIFSRASSTTTIMVAHRLSTIRDADRIYLVSNGEITETGTHEELIALGGKYCEMFTKQAEKYVETTGEYS